MVRKDALSIALTCAWLVPAVACGPAPGSDPLTRAGLDEGAAGLTDRELILSSEEQADAVFFNFDPVSCKLSSVDLFAYHDWAKSPPGSADESGLAVLLTFRATLCTGEVEVAAEGLTTDFNLTIDPTLKEARLQIPNLHVIDFNHGELLFADVDVHWTGVGPQRKESSHEEWTDPDTGVTYQNSYRGKFQDAVAQGAITVNGTNWIPEPSTSGTIRDESEVTHVISP